MPVYKYKSFEEARRALWNFNPDADYYRRIAGLFNLGFRLMQRKHSAGVFPFRSIEEASTDRKYRKIGKINR